MLVILVPEPEKYYTRQPTLKQSKKQEKLREENKIRNEKTNNSDSDFETPKKPKQPKMDGLSEMLNIVSPKTPSPLASEEEDHASPLTPMFKKDKIFASTSKYTQKSEDTITPKRKKQKPSKPELEPIFDLGLDLKGKIIQLLSWTGQRHYEEITINISDGTTWITCKLDSDYRIYLVGCMFKIYDIFKIIEYTGTLEEENLKLVIEFIF